MSHLPPYEPLIEENVPGRTCEESRCGGTDGDLAWDGGSDSETEKEADRNSGAENEATASAREGSSIHDLDEHCLYRIMCQLPCFARHVCTMVCHEWLKVSSTACPSLTLQGPPKIIKALPAFLQRFSMLRILKIGKVATPAYRCGRLLDLDDASMAVIAQHGRCLQCLEVTGCDKFGDVGIASILRGCSDLRRLRLSHCANFSRVGYGGIRCRLEHLELKACRALTNEGLHAAGTVCPKLQSLSINTEQDNVSLAVGLEGLARACGSLTELNLQACGISDTTLQCFAASWPELHLASLACERAITDEGVASFMQRLPQLDRLGLVDNDKLTRIPCSK